MNNNRTKYLFKNTLIFAISNLATKLIVFFLVPLYTNTLTPNEYGIVDLLFTIVSFLYPLLTLNIAEAIYRFSMDKDSDDKKISNIGFTCFILSIILGLITIPILKQIPDYKDYSLLFYLYLTSQSLCQILLVTLKGQEKLKLFGIGNVINTFFIALFNILFLLVFKMGINGYFLGYILSNILTIIYALIYTKTFKNFKHFSIDKKLFKEMIKYSVVLIPTSFMWWIINSSDRIMVTNMVSAAANGIYAVSYKIPSLLTVVASIFNQAWIFSAINEKDSKDKEEYTNKIFRNFFLIITLVAIVILIIIKPLFRIYVAPDYYNAWQYVPFLVFGFIFMTSATFISTSYNVYKDSKGFLFSGLAGAIVNIILNFVFIPIFGVYGAALATAISYIAVFVYRMFDTRKYVKTHFGKEQITLIISLFVVCALTYIDNICGMILQLVILVLVLWFYRNKFKIIIKDILKKILHK